jgi:hypothetical protein
MTPNLKRRAVETRMLGQVRDLLHIEAFSHSANQRAHWVCRCECGAVVIRSASTMNKNKERGRKNGCETCVPSKSITGPAKPRMTPEQREIAKAESRKRYEMKERANRSARQRSKKWYEPSERHDVIVDGAVVIGGKVVGQARTPDELAWFKRAFGECSL